MSSSQNAVKFLNTYEYMSPNKKKPVSTRSCRNGNEKDIERRDRSPLLSSMSIIVIIVNIRLHSMKTFLIQYFEMPYSAPKSIHA
jgi:hypothetical protein